MSNPTKDLLSQAINSMQEAERQFEDGNEYPGHAKASIAQAQALIVIAQQLTKIAISIEDKRPK